MEFRLVVEASDDSDQPSFALEGSRWTLSPRYDLDSDSDIPPFVCVSYRWGVEREPHALNPGLVMSARTLPSLAAAMRCAGDKHRAFWTDVFCVPSEEGPKRQSTLENMGYIYNRAAEVVIVLNGRTLATLQGMEAHGYDGEDGLRLLEQDDWVASVWTFQEIVNRTSVKFTSEVQVGSETRGASTDDERLLNTIGYSLALWKKATGSSDMDAVRQFPNVSNIEDLLASLHFDGPGVRSAFSIFSALTYKLNPDTSNYFYAILGTLTSSVEQLEWRSELGLAEKVMSICEQKNDFSYIYTIADRDTDPRQRWRPQATSAVCHGSNFPVVLRPILVWHCWGEAQFGHRDSQGLWLHGMSVMEPSTNMQNVGRKSVCNWLQLTDDSEVSVRDLGDAVYGRIVETGFRGAKKPLVSPDGFVFTAEGVEPDTVVKIFISHQIRWTMGAPGVVQTKDARGGKRYVVCALIGSTAGLLDDGETVLLD